MAVINKSNKRWGGEKETLKHCSWEMQTGAAAVKTSMEFPQKNLKWPWLEWLSGLSASL